MGRSNDAEFVELVWKNEKKILKAQSPKDLREGIEFFSQIFPGISYSSQKTFDGSKKRCGKTLEMLGLSYDFKFPEDHALKNQLWKNVIQRKLQAAREKSKYEKIAKEMGLPATSTQKDIEERKKSIAKEKRSRQKELERKQLDEKRERLGLNGKADVALADKLVSSTQRLLHHQAKNSAGYLYFKVWVMPDNSRWYKIGITNNLKRREYEQNVLPVPAETLETARFHSIEHAKIAEDAFLKTLSKYRIRGANNREIFDLKPEHVQAVIGAMKALESITF